MAEYKRINDPNQIRVISSPLRTAIHQVVVNEGKASIREIAEQLGRKPTTLYRHVQALVDAELLLEVGTAPAGNRDAKVYAPSDYRLRFQFDLDDAPMVDAVKEYTGVKFRQATRELTRAIESGAARSDGADRNTLLRNRFGWLSPEQLARANALIDELEELFQENMHRRENTELISVTVAARPLRVDR